MKPGRDSNHGGREVRLLSLCFALFGFGPWTRGKFELADHARRDHRGAIFRRSPDFSMKMSLSQLPVIRNAHDDFGMAGLAGSKLKAVRRDLDPGGVRDWLIAKGSLLIFRCQYLNPDAHG